MLLAPGGNLEGEQIRAEIERISFRNEDNGWSVVKARNCETNHALTVTGHFPPLHAGETFELFGNWNRHPHYGPQFQMERCVPIRPTSRDAVEKYLASGHIPGIGPKTAQKIVNHFGEKTLSILDENPYRVREVSSIGNKKAEAIASSWSEQKAIADVMMFLHNHGVSPAFASRIIKTYGAEAIDLVSADPYRLATDIHGIGFVSADRIAQKMGIAPDSRERIRAAVLYQMKQGEERGHCFVTSPQLLEMLTTSLGLDREVLSPRLADCLGELNQTGALVTERPQDGEAAGQSLHYRAELLAAEWNIAHAASHLLSRPLEVDDTRVSNWLARYAQATGNTLSDEQVEAVQMAAAHRVFIMTGGPGVGKTTTANAIIRLFKAMGKTVALGAPTGRAAQRLGEVAAMNAKTIHRLLEWAPHLGSFARDENNPLPVQVVIIDEASMLDVRLADALFRAIPENAQLVLIGDVDQLPSVGPGNVLRDLIESQTIPALKLSRIFRQASFSGIVQAAHTINQGVPPQLDDSPQADCRFLELETGDDIKRTIRELVQHHIPRQFGYRPKEDIQVLTPMNRGELGTATLNEELQNLLNPRRSEFEELKRRGLVLRPGDKVIQSTNNYDLGVFNGDIGFVEKVNVEGGRLIVSFADGRIVKYQDEQTLDLKLAYAITIHKSQGSEFPVVVIPVAMQHYVMLQRNLVYTALTRAKKLAIFVGSKKALGIAVHHGGNAKRQTGLIGKLAHSFADTVQAEPLT